MEKGYDKKGTLYINGKQIGNVGNAEELPPIHSPIGNRSLSNCEDCIDSKQDLETKINEFFRSHNGYVENNRIHLSVLCDSTLLFLYEMTNFLQAIGCTDIQTEGYVENDSIYGYRYKASGIMPKGMVVERIDV